MEPSEWGGDGGFRWGGDGRFRLGGVVRDGWGDAERNTPLMHRYTSEVVPMINPILTRLNGTI